MRVRPKLTYANVVATLALILAVGGGTVYAASKLKKNSVKSPQIAKGAVKSSELAKNSVNSAKVKNNTLTTLDVKEGTLSAKDLVPGLIPAVTSDVTGSTSVGPEPLLNPAELTVPVNGTTTFTPQAGQVAAIAGEASFTVADAVAGAPSCSVSVRVLVSGTGPFEGLFFSPSTTVSTTPTTSTERDAAGPFGLLSPGQPLTLSAVTEGDADCAPGTQVNSVQIRILQFD